MVEPPALFLGRGEHPKKGRIKVRHLCFVCAALVDT
jgi:hypothetical protein